MARPERFELEALWRRERGAQRRAGADSRNPERSEGSLKRESEWGMARPERFELPTYSSGGCRSIQLSYGRA